MSDKTFKAQLLTPNGSLFEGDVIGIKIPGSEGNFEILYNHAPIVSSLGVGKVEIHKPDNTVVKYALNGGFVEMNDNRVTILAEEAIEAGKIDLDKAEKEREEIKKELKNRTDGREPLEKKIAVTENLIKLARE